MNNNDSFWLRIIYVISIVISGAVAFLILGPRPEGIEGSLDVSSLPLVNASLNLVTTVLLIFGLFLILYIIGLNLDQKNILENIPKYISSY